MGGDGIDVFNILDFDFVLVGMEMVWKMIRDIVENRLIQV